MNEIPKSAIPPATIAAKLAAASNLTDPAFAEQIRKEPRLVELLWFLQWTSMQPGGLEKFALDVVEQFQPQIGPAFIHSEGDALTPEQRQTLWADMVQDIGHELIPTTAWQDPIPPGGHRDWPDYCSHPVTPREKARFQAALQKVSRSQFRARFISAAKDALPGYLRQICEGPAKWIAGAPWYCRNLIPVLFEAMDLHASRIELQLARTAVVAAVFDRLDYAWQQKVFVSIQGDARVGKTEAVRAWAAMYPGRARLISTPPGTSLHDLFAALAESFGMNFSPHAKTRELKNLVQFVLRHSGLFLILDEAHFLLPPPASRAAQPARLDYVRTQIVDRDLPVALVSTPQAFSHAVEKFRRHTGYNFDQFFGRVMLNVTLPNELDEADLLAVVKVQGPDIPEKFHRFIVARAMQSEGYLKVVEAICRRARYIAHRDGHPAIALADVELAAAEVIPSPARPAPAITAPARPKQPMAVKRGRAITPGRRVPDLEPPALALPSRPSAPPLDAPARRLSPLQDLQPV
jgi:hypothetical protein